jgi:hypothetical protein
VAQTQSTAAAAHMPQPPHRVAGPAQTASCFYTGLGDPSARRARHAPSWMVRTGAAAPMRLPPAVRALLALPALRADCGREPGAGKASGQGGGERG